MPVDEDERYDLDGLPVADGPRTFVDLAGHLEPEALVCVADVLARRWGHEALEAAVERRRKRPGLSRARAALPLLDAGSGSPAEKRARLHGPGRSAPAPAAGEGDRRVRPGRAPVG
ncbi:MAG TPA: hypothetical protein VM433_00320 [Mycobacteriales bacterium]|nr:hypothetical protein [Mycobacteriales bacterium]